MDLGLKGKLVLVTAGSKGIGTACAATFLAEGARVAICSRTQENLDRALAALPGAQAFAADCVDPAAAADMLERVESCLGPIGVLVNSAGAARRTPPPELTPARWREAFDAKFLFLHQRHRPSGEAYGDRGEGVIVSIIAAGSKVASPTHLAGGSANAACDRRTRRDLCGPGRAGCRREPRLDRNRLGRRGAGGGRQAFRRQHGGGAPAERGAASNWPSRAPARDRRCGCLSCVAEGRLCHWRDAVD